MNKPILILLLIFLSMQSVAQVDTIDLGDTPIKIISLKGKPTTISELEMKGKIFTTYYYEDTNSSYVVDKSENIVCSLERGKREGYCYPCDFGPTEGACP